MYSLKVGQAVYLRSAPSNTGTVSRVAPAGFRVTWDDRMRKRGHPRLRVTYPWNAGPSFLTGVPPSTGEE